MKKPRIFASIMFVRADLSSGVDTQELDYDPAIDIKEYCRFFLEQTKIRENVQKAEIFSLEISQHDLNGDYLLDESQQLKRRSIPFEILCVDTWTQKY